MSEDVPYEFHKHGSKELNKVFFAGYETQIRAGLGVACQTLKELAGKKDSNYKILAFGMPGTGKSSYPHALMKNICQNKEMQRFIGKIEKTSKNLNLRFSLFHVKCLGLLTTYTDLTSLKKIMNLLHQQIMENIPAVIVFDELDAFSPEKRESEYLSYWTMSFVKRRLPGLAVFGIVNYPDKLDLAVYRQFENLFYFDLPDEVTVAEILKRSGIPDYQNIARKLCVNPVDAGELMSGCSAAIKFKGNGNSTNLKGMDSEDIADFIGDYLKVPWERVRNYRMDYDYYIKKAIRHMGIWEERKRTLMH